MESYAISNNEVNESTIVIILPQLNGILLMSRSGDIREGNRMTAPRERRDASYGRQAAPVVRHETRRGCRSSRMKERKRQPILVM